MAAAWLILRYAPRWNWRREDGVSFEMLSDYIWAISEGEPATSIALRFQSVASKDDSSNSKWAEVSNSNSKYNQNSNCGALRRKRRGGGMMKDHETRTANYYNFISLLFI